MYCFGVFFFSGFCLSIFRRGFGIRASVCRSSYVVLRTPYTSNTFAYKYVLTTITTPHRKYYLVNTTPCSLPCVFSTHPATLPPHQNVQGHWVKQGCTYARRIALGPPSLVLWFWFPPFASSPVLSGAELLVLSFALLLFCSLLFLSSSVLRLFLSATHLASPLPFLLPPGSPGCFFLPSRPCRVYSVVAPCFQTLAWPAARLGPFDALFRKANERNRGHSSGWTKYPRYPKITFLNAHRHGWREKENKATNSPETGLAEKRTNEKQI